MQLAPRIDTDAITSELAAYSVSTDFAMLPADVVDRAKRVILDEIGCMILGATLPPGVRVRSYVASLRGLEQATVIGGRLRAPAAHAALVNGTASHADELDGVHATQGHPAGASVAGALALSESLTRTGRDLINAVVLSFDVGCRVLTGLGGAQVVRVQRHVHSSPLYAIGVAAAAGRLLGLDQLRLQYGMALAVLNISVPTSFFEERNHMSKALNQGQAAFAGVTGAVLASHGFEAHERILEAKDGVIDGIRTDRTNTQLMTADLGVAYSIMDAGFKYYSAGYPIHSPLYGALTLMKEHGISAGDVAAVRVGMAPASADLVDERQMPSICLQDMLSLGMVLGRLTYEDAHDNDALRRADVRRLRDAITIIRDTSLGAEAVQRRVSWIEIETVAGATHRGPERIPPGHWESGGMPWEDLRDKFTSLAQPRIGATASARLCSFVERLEEKDDLRELSRALSGSDACAAAR